MWWNSTCRIEIFLEFEKTLFLGTRLVSVTKCRFECTSCNHRKIIFKLLHLTTRRQQSSVISDTVIRTLSRNQNSIKLHLLALSLHLFYSSAGAARYHGPKRSSW
ncbi:Protein CBG14796 [Caenorhabditis briggsae]|uniref:Protein CBG14796 n=1 Tax=Caenorhabditis briggsae TaxID=6238 RepID=A8XKP6_CAEBR|nr:Protein CBG14796 [Caenorhabditis briggsae]CAP33220.1 Protein CBG14796 [Caenorhabditis briggsae]